MADGDGESGRDGNGPEEPLDVDDSKDHVEESSPEDEPLLDGDSLPSDDDSVPSAKRSGGDDLSPEEDAQSGAGSSSPFEFSIGEEDDRDFHEDVMDDAGPSEEEIDFVSSNPPSPESQSIVGRLRSLATSDTGVVVVLREVVVSVVIVAVIGLLLFSISGVWPPMVAVESGSMEPNLSRGDLVFVMEEHRFSSDVAVGDTGIVTYDRGVEHDYRQFGDNGDVIVYQPYGNEDSTPVIHRARFWVDEGENWYDRADPRYLDAESCEELQSCPAEHAGFITKGDNQLSNNYYDQSRSISSPVKPEWIRGTATFRIPWLGWIRLAVSETSPPSIGAHTAGVLGSAHSA